MSVVPVLDLLSYGCETLVDELTSRKSKVMLLSNYETLPQDTDNVKIKISSGKTDNIS